MSTTANSDQINGLNKLITTLYDGENGYKEAADEVDSVSLQQTFREYSKQRYDFGHEIKPFITQMGGTVDKGGSFSAGVHRFWMDIKSALGTNEESAILAECVRGDESAVNTYEEVMKDTALPADARNTISRQLDALRRGLAEMRRLESTYEKA
ncbi:MAG: PA2169 family four-helix-bundle protein [Saprospiraceae bacterium]